MCVCTNASMCTVQTDWWSVDSEEMEYMNDKFWEGWWGVGGWRGEYLEYLQVTGDTFNDRVILVCLTLLQGGDSCVWQSNYSAALRK